MDFGEVPTGLPFSILPFENHRVCPVLYHHSCRSLGGKSRSSIPEPGAARIGPFVLAKMCYYSTEQVHDSKVNPCAVVDCGILETEAYPNPIHCRGDKNFFG